MKQIHFQEKYPVYKLEVEKSETSHASASEIIDYFKQKIEDHKITAFIGIFDHYTHTQSLPEGKIADEIKDAQNIVFCFGTAMPNAEVLAVRPRSIGVADMGDKYVISFLEAPMQIANDTMEEWAKEIVNK